MSASRARSGGGSATSGGVEYQARVAAWIAVGILARHEATPPWSLPEDTRLETLWGETDQPVDDLLVGTSAGGFAFLQVKRRLDLSHRVGSEIASAFDQIVRQFLQWGTGSARGRAWERPVDQDRDRLVLVIGRESSRAVSVHLQRVLERLATTPFDHSLDVATNEAETEALSTLRELLRVSWRKYRGNPPHDNEVLRLAQVLRIETLDVEAGGSDEKLAKDRLHRLLVQPDQAGAAWSVLLREALRLSSHRAGTYYASLRQSLDRENIALRGTNARSRLLSSRQLLEICQAALPSQIQDLSREKYIPKLFVPRQQLDRLQSFLDAEDRFRTEAAFLLDRLREIAGDFHLDSSVLDNLLAQGPTPDRVDSALPALEKAFWFDAVESLLSRASSAVRAQTEADFQRAVREILDRLAELPFVRREGLRTAAESLLTARRRFLSEGTPKAEEFWALLPGESPDPAGLANSLLKRLTELAQRSADPCAAIVGRAGYGKTNLLCALADDLVREYPVFLLSGQMTISGDSEIETHIQRWLERGLGRSCSGWIGSVGDALEDDTTWMFVVIDAVNENTDPERMSRVLEDFAARCRGKRIKIILSCRDIFWKAFERKLAHTLYGREPVRLTEFTEPEWRQAAALYFEKFAVRCRLSPEAERTLKNPLLLRLFCQANEGKDLGEIRDLRVLDVFDQFVEHAMAQITERKSFASPALVEDLLQRIGHEMWSRRRSSVRPSEIGVTPEEQSDLRSIYNLLHSEGILSESPGDPAAARRPALDTPVQFLYERLAEYVISSSWRSRLARGDWKKAEVSRLLDEALEALPTFSLTLGALIFLSRMQSSEGELLQEILRRMAARGDEDLAGQQPAVIAAFENLPIARVGDDILQILVRFEALATPESKDALAPVILRLLGSQRDHPIVRTLALRLLEVNPDLLAATAPVQEQAAVEESAGLGGIFRAAFKTVRAKKKEPESKPEPSQLALPPARHHYPQETRLSALSLLVASKRETPDLFVQGVRKLGSLDLNDALDSFRSLDLASDPIVLSVIEHQMEARAPEYRIYCAWLLRERYGPRPAEILVRLLTDQQTRVHRYTFRLFQKRHVEADLIEAILALLESGRALSSWHLAPLLDLLGQPSRLEPGARLNDSRPRIHSALQQATRHPSPVVRKAAYLGLLVDSPPIEMEPLRQRIATDVSPSVQALAVNLN